MKKQLLILLVIVTSIGFAQEGKAQNDSFMAFNYYPEYTIGLSTKDMLARYPVLKEMKKYNMLMHKKFNYYSPSFQIKDGKVYGYSGYLYLSNQLSDDNPTRTSALTEKHLKSLTEKFQFQPKVDEKSFTEEGSAFTTIDYTWEKGGKKFVLSEQSSYDAKKIYYGFITILSSDENLLK